MNSAEIIWLQSKCCLLFSDLLHVVIPNELLEIATILLSFVVISVIVVILFSLLKKAKLKQQQLYFKKIFNDLISEIAICETEEELNVAFSNETYQEIFEQYQLKPLDRNFLIDELATTCKEFNGVTRANIHWLFQKTTLRRDLLENLKDKHWYIVAKTVQQIAYLQLKDMLPHIFLLANHNNDLVRMEAQVATVKLVGFNGLRFLNVINYPISEWQQLRLIQELSEHPVNRFDAIENWLKSNNNSVVEFALRLVSIYQRHEYYEPVTKSLSHPTESIALLAVEAMGKISNEKTTELLINLFPNFSSCVQYKITETLKSIGSENELANLQGMLSHPTHTKTILDTNATNNSEAKEIETADTNAARLNRNIIVPKLNMGGAI